MRTQLLLLLVLSFCLSLTFMLLAHQLQFDTIGGEATHLYPTQDNPLRLVPGKYVVFHEEGVSRDQKLVKKTALHERPNIVFICKSFLSPTDAQSVSGG